LETWQFKSVIDQAKQLGALYITFSGGEPLLREDTVELVEHAHGKGLLTRINTNGLLLDRERVSKLKKAGLTQCGVSIDDADPHTHDRLRGVAGAHKKVLQGIKNLREFNIPCQILVYASKRNVTSGLEKVINLGRQLGVLSVYILFPVAIGRWDGAFEQLLTKEEKARVRELQDLTFVHVEIPTSRAMCAVFAKSVLFVSPQGDVTPCPFIPYVIGNIKNHTLEELWHCYSAKLSGGYRGDCVLNSTEHREVLQRHVESVARTLRRSPS
jgi:MoaA/NifB/PqqE/SkfB family radical SAM enzyme